MHLVSVSREGWNVYCQAIKPGVLDIIDAAARMIAGGKRKTGLPGNSHQRGCACPKRSFERSRQAVKINLPRHALGGSLRAATFCKMKAHREENVFGMKKKVHGAAILIAACLLLVSCTGTDINQIEIRMPDLSKIPDGTYIGTQTVFPVRVKVSVTVASGKITRFTILRHFPSDHGFSSMPCLVLLSQAK